MKQIAVDIVLLPEQAVSDWAIETNRALVRQGNTEIRLHAQTCLPHVSLAMGVLSSDDIPEMAERLTGAWQEHPVNELESLGIAVIKNHRGRFISSLALKPTACLQQLHEYIMQTAAPYLGHNNVEAHMFSGDDPIAETAIQWVSAYDQKAAFQDFQPHITLGYGTPQVDTYPDTFHPCALALCHLGNHCTCRDILWSLDIETDDR